MLALISDAGVTHIACAFDHVIESFRNDLFPGYKTGVGIDPDLYAQFSLAEQAVDALGIVVWPMVEFEADDAIATAAARFKKILALIKLSSAPLIRTWLNWSLGTTSFVGIGAGISSMMRPGCPLSTAYRRPLSRTGWRW